MWRSRSSLTWVRMWSWGIHRGLSTWTRIFLNQVLPSCHRYQKTDRSNEGTWSGRARPQQLPGQRQQHQDGSGNRGLPAHRVRVQQEQISPSGCDRWQDLLPACSYQDQVHGDCNSENRSRWIRAQHIQGIGNSGQVRDYGRSAGAWRVHSDQTIPCRIRAGTVNERCWKKVFRQVFLEPGACRRGGSQILQAASMRRKLYL